MKPHNSRPNLMRRSLSLFVLVVFPFFVAASAPPPDGGQRPAPAVVTELSPLFPWPGRPAPQDCGGGGPKLKDNQSVESCCLRGRVLVEGVAVEQAWITALTENQTRVSVRTTLTRGGLEPMYRIDLSAAPLYLKPNQSLRLEVSFKGRHIVHTLIARSGLQEFDVIF